MVIRTALWMSCLSSLLAVASCGGTSGSGDPPFTGITVPLVSLRSTAYTAPLSVGAQTFQAQVDTGSTVTAVAATTCGTACSGVSPLYTPGATATDTDKTDSATYGDNSMWNGEIFSDTAGVASDAMVKLDFVAIDGQSMFFDSNDYQGILGLGPSDLLDPGTTAYPDLVAAAGTPDIYAFQECPDKGQLFLGGFDESATASPPEVTPMRPMSAEGEPFYAVDIASLSFGSASLGDAATFGDTLVDTGTSVTLVPTTVATTLIADVNASAGFKALFPGQTFANTDNGQCVGSSTVTTSQIDSMLPPMTISFPSVDGSTPKVMSLAPSQSYIYVEGDGTFCLSVVDSGGSASDGSLIGDTMQQAFVTVFDIEHKQLGFAPEAGCAEAVAQGLPTPQIARDVTGPWWKTNPNVHAPTTRGPLAHRH